MEQYQYKSYNDVRYTNLDWWMALPIDLQDYDTITATLAAFATARGCVPPHEKDWNGVPKDPQQFTFESVVAELKDRVQGFRLNRTWGTSTKELVGFWGFCPEGAVCFYRESDSGGSYRITVSANQNSTLYQVVADIGSRLSKIQVRGTVFMAVSGKASVEFKPMGVGGEALVAQNYTDEVNADFGRISAELQAAKPRGRLTIINGPPGTGKSFFIRGLIHSCTGAVFIIVQPDFLRDLVSPQGLSMLMAFRADHSDKKIVVVLEDADDALAPRNDTDMGVISALLNLGDGILGAVMDVRIVATTNRETQEFDPALKRPGRLSTHTTIGPLPWTKAAARIEEMLGEPLAPEGPEWKQGPMTLGEIYQKVYDQNWRAANETKKQRKVGFGP